VTLSGLLNTAWLATCMRESTAFSRATRRVQQTQSRLLAQILRDNRDTVFGRDHHFDAITNPREFQQHVPLSRFEDYDKSMSRITAGEPNILTHDRVTLLQPTSGTLGEKLIPYNAALRTQFQRMIKAWIGDLFRQRPAVRAGRAYWSISPAMPKRSTAAGVPIGFDDDAEYLSAGERWMLQRLLVTPPAISSVTDIEAFRYCTLLALLHADDLSLISIWSPTFLLCLIASLHEWPERLCLNIERGGCDFSPMVPPSVAEWFAPKVNAERAREVRETLRSKASMPEKMKRLWPRLALISCWTNAGSAPYAAQLAAMFPHVEIQAKGLLATEGCVTIPLVGKPAPALALRSHFFEFQLAHGDETCLAHELETGARYNVILTTGGGLYRYQLRDQVDVVGYEAQCPLLRFVGKADQVSDMVGEKLSEEFVGKTLGEWLSQPARRAAFAMLVPVAEPTPHYRLYLQLAAGVESALTGELDVMLRDNPHYDYARRLGQLGAPEVTMIDPAEPPAWGVYEREMLRRGVRAGNIKPVALDRSLDWPQTFAEAYRKKM
jgi:hypothetical protein